VTGITAPVYGFYAGDDARIGATLPDTTEAMKKAGKKYEVVSYAGAGHGFMRAGEDPKDGTAIQDTENQSEIDKVRARAAANRKARSEAWQRWLELLKAM
jgi:carboxymethylenebutenolidase